MSIYKFRASIEGSKVFMREYEVKAGMTLYDFHDYLIGDLDFAPDQMVLFRGLDAVGNIKSEYGLFDMGDGSMDSITIEDLLAKKENLFLYVFDVRKDRSILFTFVEEVNEHPRASYPRLTAEKGRNPDQFAKRYDDMEQFVESSSYEMKEDDSIDDEELPEGEEYL